MYLLISQYCRIHDMKVHEFIRLKFALVVFLSSCSIEFVSSGQVSDSQGLPVWFTCKARVQGSEVSRIYQQLHP